MRIERFKDWLEGELVARGVEVARYEVDTDRTGLAVKDGESEILLHLVGTSNGGEDYSKPEEIVRRPAGAPIRVKHR